MTKASRQLGPYELLAVVGAGGMGVVYRARDTRLDRQVAVKVLLPEVANDAQALARFEREARAVAALCHPNILTIHDFGAHEGSAYIVMELLDGPTLRAMLERGALPARKAVALAVQIAHGLAAAHDRNIVHRDLKPENIGLMRSGQVKILDFGLARYTVRSDLLSSNSTTGEVISRAGVVFGTVAYMSPEQVRGEEVDHRSDLFSLGIVLHEMLTNHRAFSRATAAETLTAILNDEPPDLQQSGAKVPPALDRVIHRCLEKQPEDRFDSADDLAFALEEALASTSGEIPAVPRRSPSLALSAALLVCSLTVAVAAMALWPRSAEEAPAVRFLTFSGTDSEPTASPTGDEIVYASNRGGGPTLWIREVDVGSRRAIVERDLHITGGHRPRFFRDGKRLLFLQMGGSSEAAYEVAINGGYRDLILENVFDAEPSPTNNDEIAFVRLSVDASGKHSAGLGVFNARTKGTDILLQEANIEYVNARWSPDGRRIATIRRSASATENSIVIVDRQSRASRNVKPEGRGTFGALAWNGDGHTVIATESPDAQVFVPGMLARIMKIDIESGSQQLLFRQGNLFGLFGAAEANATMDVAGDGRLVFSTIEIHQNLRECALSGEGCVDPAPGESRAVGTTGYSNDRQPTYSPNGDFVIFSSNRSGDLDLWVQSTRDGAMWPLTQDTELDWDPAFTPDGKRILWSSDRETHHLEIWMANFDSARLDRGALSGIRRVSADGKDAENPTMTKDLEWVVYASSNSAKPGIWKIRPDGRDAAQLVPGSPYYNIPDVSPDGRYAAYVVSDSVNLKNTIHVAGIETRRDSGFEVRIPYRRQLASRDVTWGRARWTPDGLWLVFIGQDEAGRAAVYKQRFSPGADTTATRQRTVSSLPGALTESLAMSPDGRFITVSDGYYVRRLMLAEHVPGVDARRRAP